MQTLSSIVLLLCVLWFLGIILVLFRNDIGFPYKISFTIVFLLFGFYFFPEISASLDRFLKSPGPELKRTVIGILNNSVLFLVYFWPLYLFWLFFSRLHHPDTAIGRILFLYTTLILALWALYLRFPLQFHSLSIWR